MTRATTPTPEDVQDARAFLHGVRASIETDTHAAPFETTESQLNSVLTLGARFIPGFRGRIEVVADVVIGTVSVPVPGTGQSTWLNLFVTAPAFEGQFAFSHVAVGSLSLPPGGALNLARIGANMAFGTRLGDTVLSSATAMRIQEDMVSFDLAIDEIGKNGVMRGVFGTLRGSELPDTQDIDRYYVLIRDAMEDGILPTEGSYLPYLQFTLAAALEGSATEGIPNAYTSAIFALTRICGARDFTMVVGGLAGGAALTDKGWRTDCKDLTLNERIDSRRHFTTAAALQAASNRGFAVSVGEFKELYDSLNAEKGGFDFTDLAANNSGIRMSNRLMAVPAEDWLGLMSRITEENNVIVTFDDIPQLMSRDTFQEKYGDVDSPEYQAKLALIETRIDALTLHR
ncbi:MAG: hypothetical protein ABJX32_04330 [Tateyamaria sp.]|uniref:hypothetical protein n=1 Tax=Tateyamaria sp. TaxID=1929288 RepID=UPI0032A0FCFD